jgi:hypothetical protein
MTYHQIAELVKYGNAVSLIYDRYSKIHITIIEQYCYRKGYAAGISLFQKLIDAVEALIETKSKSFRKAEPIQVPEKTK